MYIVTGTFLYFLYLPLPILSTSSHTSYKSQLFVMALLITLKSWDSQDWPSQVGFGEEGIVRLVGTQKREYQVPLL